ncbi:helix-turn-helix domain-containing protein [Streptomyces griseocarneus]|uniref:AraC-like ligand-binding domain-containing protein n=1 Tax=Streptomyces griseocarneus TaxID=51201 RepID=UPI0019AA5996|nr:helix-turn-helix domain-containing protein [Streptomyces griseocarneus]MBZ6475205.1 helix-turn-helix domain-containing protein [Streptomyces griseocarneus]GHG61671.1 AraC family transcriptional regulator [Streptomyces griseocarneus]
MHTDAGTTALPETGPLGPWQRELDRELAAVQVRSRQEHAFDGALGTLRLGYLRLLSLEADPVYLSRPPRLVDRAPADAVAVALQQSGTAALTQDGRGAVLLPGHLAVIDLRRPFALEQKERFRQRLFRVPARALNVPAAHVRWTTGRAFAPGDGVVALLAPFLDRLADDAGRIPPAVGDRLAGNVTDLLAALVDACAEGGDDRTGVADDDHLPAAVRRYIDRNLSDPGLTPESIATAHRISVRYLHRLFEGEGVTVSKLIQRRRVEECGKELARRGRVAPTISAVALRWGFHSPAHFSRAFKAVYGCSPRDWRTAEPVPAAPHPSGDSPGAPGVRRARQVLGDMP